MGSLRSEPELLDDPAPLLGVSARHRGELSGRGRRRLDRDVLHPFLDFGQGQNAADLGIEPTDDLARHSGGTVGGVQETTGTYD
jgi:hypothetical protein